MVYIYKKTVGTKEYYYLRASERKNGKIVVKDIAYLGDNLETVRKELVNLPKYSEQIRKAYKTINNFLELNRYLEKIKALKLKSDAFLGSKLLNVEACKLHYNSEFKHNQELTKQEIWKNFMIEFAYNTASIEGNTIKLNEARNLLQEGVTPKNKPLRDIYDLKNTEDVFMKLFYFKEEINHNFIIDIHKELLKNIDPRIGYRTQDVRVIKANFKATPTPYVKTDMDLLLEWYEKNRNKLHPLVLAIIFHHKFEKIHPFFDGNGRTGRMLMNYILIQNNYPPIVIHTKLKTSYLQALRKADNSNLTKNEKEDYDKIIEFIVDEMSNTYWNIFL